MSAGVVQSQALNSSVLCLTSGLCQILHAELRSQACMVGFVFAFTMVDGRALAYDRFEYELLS